MKNLHTLFLGLTLLFINITGLTVDLSAQNLNDNGNPHTIYSNGGANNWEGSPQDYTIPNNSQYNSIQFELKGGDGGYVSIIDHGCRSGGGEGATTTAVFIIGTGTNELRPGGTIRFIVGKRGLSQSVGFGGGGAGGGGTAVLYRPSNLNSWTILAVAGGGGGAYQGYFTQCIDSQKGQGGRSTESGGNGEGSGGGAGGINGQGGSSGDSFQAGYGGGGAYSDGDGGGAQGYPNGGNGSGNKGGFGFGGGGDDQTSNEGGGLGGGGGGGGGYSGGGGGDSANNGGGGGSYVNATYAYSHNIQEGSLGGGDDNNGSVRYTFQCTSEGLANSVPTASCKSRSINVDASGSVTVTAQSFDNGSTVGCGLDLSFTFSGGATSRTYTCSSNPASQIFTIIVTASNGNSANCLAGLTIIDLCDPLVTCVGSLTVSAGETISAESLIATNDDPQAGLLTYEFGDGATSRTYDCNDIGSTISETVITTDPAGNTTTCEVDITVSSDNTVAVWTGVVSSAWDEPCNWLNGLVPENTTQVTIPDVDNDPVISGTTSAVALTVSIEASGLLTVNDGGSLELSSNFIVNGALAIQSGGIMSTARVTVNNGGSVTNDGTISVITTSFVNNAGGTVQGNGLYEIASHWSNSGTFYAGDSKVKITGVSESIIGGSNPSTFYDLEIERIGGGVAAALQNSCTVEHELIMTQGPLNLNGYNLTVNGSIINESSSSYIYGSGVITKTLNLNAPNTINPGNLGVEITSDANLGLTTIQRGHTIQDVDGNAGIKRYYDISPANNTGLDASVNFHYLDHELNGIPETDLAPFRFDGTNWEERPVSDRSSSNNFVETTHVDAFSTWTLAANCGATNTYYRDADGDGYGTPVDSVFFCSAPSGYVADNTDCNDTDANVNPTPDCSTTTRIWTGHVSTDWNEACNWSPNCVPTASEDVFIPDVVNDPIIADGTTIVVKSIVIEDAGIMTNNGHLTMDNGNIWIKPGAALQGDGTYIVQGDWVNDGNFNAGSSFVGMRGNVQISGATETIFYELSAFASNTTLAVPIRVDHILYLSLGTLNLNGHDLTLYSTAIIQGETSAGYIFSTNGGVVKITNALNAPSAVNLGNIGVTITSAANLSLVTIQRGYTVQDVNGEMSISRYYDITPLNNSGLDATVRFSYLDHELNGIAEQDLTLFRFNGTDWDNYPVTAVDATANWVETQNVDAFSTWTLASVCGLNTYYADTDGDGYGDPAVSVMQCAPPDGYVADNTDCDDNDADEFPGQIWYSDLDNDGYPGNGILEACERPTGFKLADELISLSSIDCDDNDPAVHISQTWYRDADNDNYPSGAIAQSCHRPPGYKLASELVNTTDIDCNDSDPNVNPGATETCNGSDDNCNDQIDEGVQTVYYADSDGDGFGNPAVSIADCSAPDGYVADNTDCNDSDPNEFPDQVWYEDADEDGVSSGAMLTKCERPAGYFTSEELSALSGDNCPDLYNPSQADIDGAGIGDACDCDPDSAGDEYLLIIDNSNLPDGTYQANREMEVTATVATGTTAILTAGRKIRFLPGFVADAGSDLHAYIDSCATPEVSTSTTLSKSEDVTATDQVIPATVLSGADQSADTGLEVFPNPFTTEVTIRFYLQEAGQTTLNIFDLQGRLVRQLHQETLDAGSYQWQWDGTGRGGNRLPSGMYLVQLRSAEVVVNKRVLFQYD